MKKHQPDWTDFRNIHIPDIIIDPSDPNSYSNKVLPEQETRKRLLTHARLIGCEREMMLLFIKYDKLIRSCSNEQERRDMGKLAATEVLKLFGENSDLSVDGQLI